MPRHTRVSLLCADSAPYQAFLIASCPSPAYIDNVISANMLASLDPETLFKRVFHIVGRKVINHPRYTAWMATFPDDVEVGSTLRLT